MQVACGKYHGTQLGTPRSQSRAVWDYGFGLEGTYILLVWIGKMCFIASFQLDSSIDQMQTQLFTLVPSIKPLHSLAVHMTAHLLIHGPW